MYKFDPYDLAGHYFVYSSHSTQAKALAALEDYFANGEVCEAEHPQIVKRGARYCVMFPGA